MGRAEQRKGRAAELELVGILNDHGIPARPGEPMNYGSEADIVGVAGVHVEVKRAEQLRLPEWLSQAERDAQRFGGWPCLFFRRSRERWRVVVPLELWITMYQAWEEVNDSEE